MELQEAKSKYGKVRIYSVGTEDDNGDTSKIDVICRKPTRGEMVRFGSGLMSSDPQSKVEALEGLVICCTVSPPIDPLLDENYGIVFELGNKLAAWAGVGKGAEAKK